MYALDTDILWRLGDSFVLLNKTILYTWIVMAVLVAGSLIITWRLSSGPRMDRWQNLLEIVVSFLRREIRQVSRQNPDPYLPFVGTLFVFIAAASILDLVPYFSSPAGSIATTAALAVCVFFAVPIYGVARGGFGGYLKNYIRPSVFMLPFNIIGEMSRTLALAVRLFGNVMSGAMVVGVLLSIVPFIFPAVMQFMGLVFGMIQAYIFSVLAMVYISSGIQARETQQQKAHERARKAPHEREDPNPPREAPGPTAKADEPPSSPPRQRRGTQGRHETNAHDETGEKGSTND